VRRNASFKLAVVGTALVLAGCADQQGGTAPQVPAPEFSQGQGQGPEVSRHIFELRGMQPPGGRDDGLLEQAKPGGGGGHGNTGIFFHGGPVLLSPRVQAVYWGTSRIYTGGPTPGTTGSGASDGSLVGFFIGNIGGAGYWNINHTYSNGSGTLINNSLAYDGFWAANSAPPSAPSDAQIANLIISGFNGGQLTYDASTIYPVFTGPGVNLGGGFGSQYCAYHGHFTWNGNSVKYAAMPYNQDFPSGCTSGRSAPNGDPAADAEVNTLVHELEEATTDPDLNAWYDRRGQENADKCAWNFGTTANSNISIGGKSFLVQMNWINTGSGGCRISNP
jgi:hypothetical protein